MKTWLILDSDYLCHRAFYSTGELAFQGEGTGVIYGYLREVLSLQERFRTNNMVFCWDFGLSLRKEVYPAYKMNRQSVCLDPVDVKRRNDMRKQMADLRETYLNDIGFRNVFAQDGYEADDLAASVVMNLPSGDRAIVVSSDQDLYQLLNHKVSIWNPHKKALIDEKSFESFYNIQPSRWYLVKAMAGCTSDNVKGIPGIGEHKAAQFLQGKLKRDSKTHQKILDGESIWQKNLPIVRLPFPGTRVFTLVQDEVTRKGWRKVCNSLGLRTLLHQAVSTVTK